MMGSTEELSYLGPDVVWVHSELSDVIGDKFLHFCHVSTDGHIAPLHGSHHLKEPGWDGLEGFALKEKNIDCQ